MKTKFMGTKIIHYDREYELVKSYKIEIVFHSFGTFDYTVNKYTCISDENYNIFVFNEPFASIYYSLDSLFNSLYENIEIEKFIFEYNKN